MFKALDLENGVLRMIDQRLLPAEEVWTSCTDAESVATAIEDMVVRGAPAIGCAAAYGLALDAHAAARRGGAWRDYQAAFAASDQRLARTRPTAVNLFYALDCMRRCAKAIPAGAPLADAARTLMTEAQRLFDDDLATCKAIGAHGAELAKGRRLRVLTHCNAGALATAGYGTALGVIRALHAAGQIEMAYADETRPFLQGSRLTAYELKTEGIPYKVIVDSAAAYLMQQKRIDWVVLGADRIARNGDTANKIGTYGLAVQCKHHDVEFYVAAPLSTFDPKIATGAEIPVEERHPDEIRVTAGRQMAPKDAGVYNPSFDVTPSSLITGIITESGVLRPPYGASVQAALDRSPRHRA